MTTKPPEPPHPLDGKMTEIQERAAFHALMKTKGNRTRAARRLGVATRTIRLWLDRYPSLKKAFPNKRNQHRDIVPAGVVERDGQTAFIIKGE